MESRLDRQGLCKHRQGLCKHRQGLCKHRQGLCKHRDQLEFKLYEWLYRARQGNAEAPAQIRQLEWELAVVDQAIANTYRSLGQQIY